MTDANIVDLRVDLDETIRAMRNANVVRAWSRGTAARSHTGNLWTDGTQLYSYNLCIGTNANGATVFGYTATGDRYYVSQTTSCHVGLARRLTV
jgi:hypothetical protein